MGRTRRRIGKKMEDIKTCDVCREIVRIYGEIYISYNTRWFKKQRITVCEHCENTLPPETDEDRPSFVNEWIRQVNNGER